MQWWFTISRRNTDAEDSYYNDDILDVIGDSHNIDENREEDNSNDDDNDDDDDDHDDADDDDDDDYNFCETYLTFI